MGMRLVVNGAAVAGEFRWHCPALTGWVCAVVKFSLAIL
jgi:hypothetical protein